MTRPHPQERSYYTVGNSPFVYASDVCNNDCRFCFEADRDLTRKSKSQIFDEMNIIRQNYDFISIMGREPTLRGDIFELSLHARKLDFKQIGITTNGRMLAYPSFVRRLLGSGVNQIGITVMGHTAELHDWHTRARGSFSQTLAGIKNVIALGGAHISLLLNIMVTRKNYSQLPHIISYYADFGIREMNIGHIMPANRETECSREIIAKMSDVVPHLIEAQEKYGKSIRFYFVEYPACVFPPPYKHLAFPCLEENADKIRIAACPKCAFRDKCSGIFKGYIEIYGEDEFAC